MRYAQTVEPWRHYFNQSSSLFVAIFLTIASACAAQATASARPDPPWLQDVQKDPALLVEFGQLMTKLQHDVQFPPPRGRAAYCHCCRSRRLFMPRFPTTATPPIRP